MADPQVMKGLLLIYVASAVFGCGRSTNEPDLGPPPLKGTAGSAPRPAVNPRLLRRFRPLRVTAPTADPVARAQIELGKQLFFDPRLSRHGDVSCNSCHALDDAGVDRREVSVGTQGKVGQRNAPTVLNAAGQVAQFWDGRAATLQAQAEGPILNPNEMAMPHREAVGGVLRSIPGYVTQFRAAFPRGTAIDLEHAAIAIAAFERTLVTPGRWDRYLSGDPAALTSQELEGLKVFSDIGCVQCHTGELVGGSMFQRVGLVTPWPNQNDLGRYDITKLESDKMVFKVPTLRNVWLTAPYFHDGSVATLDVAIRTMARHQIGIEVTDGEAAAIKAWLQTLTAEAPVSIAAPSLPADGPTTTAFMSRMRQ